MSGEPTFPLDADEPDEPTPPAFELAPAPREEPAPTPAKRGRPPRDRAGEKARAAQKKAPPPPPKPSAPPVLAPVAMPVVGPTWRAQLNAATTEVEALAVGLGHAHDEYALVVGIFDKLLSLRGRLEWAETKRARGGR